MDVSVIVISYNSRDLAIACLRSVYEQTRDLSFEVIVVDNASSDGTVPAIQQEFHQATVISSSRNLGFAAACNLAAEKAKGDHLLLLNPDTVVLDDAIQKLHAFARQNPELGIYGGRTVFENGSLNPASCWGRPTPWALFCRAVGLAALSPHSSIFNSEAYGGWQRDSVREVDIVSGCFFLIQRSVWDRLGGFDTAFFMYGEDADLCLRARLLGIRPTITPDAQVIHYGAGTESVRADKLIRLFTAKRLLVERHWPSHSRVLGRAIVRLFVAIRSLGYRLAVRLGREDAAEQARTWEQVWRRRREWDTGRPTWAREAIEPHEDRSR